MATQNPYSPVFGTEPFRKISRQSEIKDIIDDFNSERPSRRNIMVTGVRGAGKTVFMTEVADELKAKDDWIVLRLNPERNLLDDFLHKLASHKRLREKIKPSKINLSFFGIGAEWATGQQITNIEVAIQELLEWIKTKGKKVVVCIDEISNTPQAKEFFSSYQIFIGDKLPLFFIGTGLYENIQALKNEPNMTFLYRMPRVELESLSIREITTDYEENLCLSRTEARELAKQTMGYSFAFQALGYYYYQECVIKKSMDKVRAEKLFHERLEEDAYTKIWEDMSIKDQELIVAIAQSSSGKISEIKERLGWNNNYLNQYRIRLMKSGLVNGSVRGQLSFAIPWFKEYVLENKMYGQEAF